MAQSMDQAGILIIYEADGFQWAEEFASSLASDNIPSDACHWKNLNRKSADLHPVHVLVLSLEMKPVIEDVKFSYLRNDSETSLLVECNAKSKGLRMAKWRNVRTIDSTPEKQQKILKELDEMYALAMYQPGLVNGQKETQEAVKGTSLNTFRGVLKGMQKGYRKIKSIKKIFEEVVGTGTDEEQDDE